MVFAGRGGRGVNKRERGKQLDTLYYYVFALCSDNNRLQPRLQRGPPRLGQNLQAARLCRGAAVHPSLDDPSG